MARTYNINTQRTVQDLSDFYIHFEGHPDYDPSRIQNTSIADVLVNMVEMILFTNKGEMLGDPEFGADLETMVWHTRMDAGAIKRAIVDQIDTYIPTLRPEDYSVEVELYKGTLRDIALVYITLNGKTISARFA